jgi:outer membrane lipoprotein-sorting protein
MRLRAALIVLCLALPATAWADARAQLHAAFVKFLAQSSFEARTHAEVGGRAIESVVEFQAPDRYRVTSAGRPPSVIVGSTMYLALNGRTLQVPMPAGTIDQFRDPAVLTRVERSASVEDLGADAVGGVPAHKYRFRTGGATPGDSVVWVGTASGLPIQVRATSTGKATVVSTVTYARYGDPSIRVAAPK